MQHQYIEPKDCESCNTPSDYPRTCMVCDGGLGICKVCGLTEGCLTTDCPGEECFAEKHDEIYAGNLDFRDGQWVNECTPHSPASFRKFKAEEKEAA